MLEVSGLEVRYGVLHAVRGIDLKLDGGQVAVGLAPIIVDKIIESVALIAERGLSILMVEQNALAAFELAHYAYVLEQGEVILEGPVDQVKDDPLVLRAFLGIESEEALLKEGST